MGVSAAGAPLALYARLARDPQWARWRVLVLGWRVLGWVTLQVPLPSVRFGPQQRLWLLLGRMTPPSQEIVMGRALAVRLAVSCSLLAPGPMRAQVAPPPTSAAEDSASVEVTWGVHIPMRDGAYLNATLYRPARVPGPLPVVFTMTPYTADRGHARALYFARRGYACALVDVRGRGNSPGAFDPFVNDAHDGYDVVEWLATRPWASGQVAMWGGSYAGFVQWATLKEAPPHLTTIVPVASGHPGVSFPYVNNITAPYLIQWLTFTSGVASQDNLYDDADYWGDRFRELFRRQLPFHSLDSLAGNPSAVFQRWLQHPTPDAHWDSLVPMASEYAHMHVPILTITGHYDAQQPGAMAYYREHLQWGAPDATANHYLIIGPWDHAGTRTPARDVGGLTFGAASLLDLNALHREWYDWIMRSGTRPAFLRDRVAYYVVGPGAERWRYAPSLDGIAHDTMTLYLRSGPTGAGSVFASGVLDAAPPDRDGHAQYRYDPHDTRRGEAEPLEDETGAWATDQRLPLAIAGDGVIYHSAPFPGPTEISGFVALQVWISLDVPDTDFRVRLYEILADGSSVLLTDDLQRARYRHSLRRAVLVQPGTIERYDFASFAFFSRLIGRGSRLRLVITAPNSYSFQKNYNSGGAVETESGADARVATVTVYHDPMHPSALRLPVAR